MTDQPFVQRRRVHLASSSGGHIDLLMRLASAAEGLDRVYVTQDSGPASELEHAGERVELLPRYHRNPIAGKLHVVLWRSLRVALRDRPRVVVTTGTGLVVPFCVFAKVLGGRIVFVETAARITRPSAAGRVLARLASTTLVQWPAMQQVYPRARLCRPSIVDAVNAEERVDGEGTFVGVGTHTYPFDRLLSAVSAAVERGVLPAPVTAQIGVAASAPDGFRAADWMSPQQINEAMASSRYVVCHAGSGLISTALSHGRRPIVMARRSDRHEHYDDHQREAVAELAALGLIVRADEEVDRDAVAAVNATPLPTPEASTLPGLTEELARVLEDSALWS